MDVVGRPLHLGAHHGQISSFGLKHCIEALCSHCLTTQFKVSLHWTTPIVEAVGKGQTLACLGLLDIDRAVRLQLPGAHAMKSGTIALYLEVS
jgi:hypothetical protein